MPEEEKKQEDIKQDELNETDKAFDAMVADYEAKLADKDKKLTDANKMIASLSKRLREVEISNDNEDEEDTKSIDDTWGEILGTEDWKHEKNA